MRRRIYLRELLWTHGLRAGVNSVLRHERTAGYACFANAHMCGEATQDADLYAAMRAATWVFPDGAPVALMQRVLRTGTHHRVSGPDFTLSILKACAQEQLPVFFFGGTADALQQLHRTLARTLPSLPIAGHLSPRFAHWSTQEEHEQARIIAESGARICFVGLGCPKQEKWMFRNAAATHTMCLGIGAAIPMLAGQTPRAPKWVRQFHSEWLYRWQQEPARLTRRYTQGNLNFAKAAWDELRRGITTT
ncbi:MAG: WecB/TagA/CpsF family glycosyltransferase [Planctomycetota bacterium]|jgi:N-acetylglucosaminyldiphosphoundecaprenol N-acetyl-beta-D-mannosaminyltransferase|nr:WecB/TagA/CpsF family glycosyltransferase [Planctomycetota bacterium]